MADDAFTITDFALSTQKKFATKLASTGAIRNRLIDEESEKLFKTIHAIYKMYYNDKKQSEKLMKDTVKIIVKLGVLERAGKLDKSTSSRANQILKNVVMTLISFSEVEFSFDKNLADKKMGELKSILHDLLKSGKVKEKTHGRLDNIFSVLGNADFLYEFYVNDAKYKDLQTRLTEHLNYTIEHKRL